MFANPIRVADSWSAARDLSIGTPDFRSVYICRLKSSMSSTVTFSVLSRRSHPSPERAFGPEVGLMSMGDTPLVWS